MTVDRQPGDDPPRGWGWWRVFTTAPGGCAQQHIVPGQDIHAHKLGEDCPCLPVEDDIQPDIWNHHAWDGREDYEARERLPH